MPESNEKVKKILFNQVSFVLAIAGVIIGTVLFITGPDAEMRQDIAVMKRSIDLIETNHLIDLKEMLVRERERNDKQDEILNKMQNNITEILTILRQ